MYYLSKATVKQTDRRFNNTGHDYELTMRRDTEVHIGEEGEFTALTCFVC